MREPFFLSYFDPAASSQKGYFGMTSMRETRGVCLRFHDSPTQQASPSHDRYISPTLGQEVNTFHLQRSASEVLYPLIKGPFKYQTVII